MSHLRVDETTGIDPNVSFSLTRSETEAIILSGDSGRLSLFSKLI